MTTYTVTLSGREREDGEKPRDYVVLAHHLAGAVEQATDAEMQGRRLQDECDIWVERCRPGLHADGYFIDLRTERA
jgi:hypothetical protein